jgi:hypothetical protein
VAKKPAKQPRSSSKSKKTTKKTAPRRRSSSPIDPGPPLNLPAGVSEELEPSRLLLDPGNLRLMEAADERIRNTPARLIGQDAIQSRMQDIVCLSSQFGVDDLITSISYNGFPRVCSPQRVIFSERLSSGACGLSMSERPCLRFWRRSLLVAGNDRYRPRIFSV